MDAPGLYDQIHDRFVLNMYLPDGAAVVLTLWGGHTHAIRAFPLSPRLNLSSSESGHGKSTALDILSLICPKVLQTENLKTPVLFRAVNQEQPKPPTLLLDEIDTYLHLYPELRGLLNGGNKEGACVYRCEGRVVRAYQAYAPVALAGIGELPPTLADRSIIIRLAKAPEGALRKPFDKKNAEIERVLGRKLARWAQDNFDAIAACKPVMPAAAFNRLGDKWRPLFQIAQIVGGHWPARVTEAFYALNLPSSSSSSSSLSCSKNQKPETPTGALSYSLLPAPNAGLPLEGNSAIALGSALPSVVPHSALPVPHSSNPSIQSLRLLLLADLRQIFAQTAADRLSSTELVSALLALPSRPWSTLQRGKPITQTWLARRLRSLGIQPRNLRLNGTQRKGYDSLQFRFSLTPAPAMRF